MTLVVFLFFLNILILVHELGHFYFAKKLKLKVEEFSIGFPPKIFSKQIKDTIYSIGIILFGGYVKLKGEDDPADKNGFLNLDPIKKILIISGGVIFNIILAYFLFSLSFIYGYPIKSEKIVITGFLKDSDFKEVLKIGDEILKIKYKENFFYFKNPDEFSGFIRTHPNQEIEIYLLRNGTEKNIKIKIPKEGILGIYLSNFQIKKIGYPLNFVEAGKELIYNLINFVKGLVVAIYSILQKEKISIEIIGPIGIYNIFENIKNIGLGYILYFVGILSLNLAIINFLPFPGLDGGRFIFSFYEFISKKRINYHKEKFIHQIGIFFLILLMTVVTFKDIIKLWKK